MCRTGRSPRRCRSGPRLHRRDRVDEDLFERLVVHIRDHGCDGRFYERVITYYDEAGLVYLDDGGAVIRDDHRQPVSQ